MYFTQEGQFRNYFEKRARVQGRNRRTAAAAAGAASGQRCVSPGICGMSRRQARQLVRHGHVAVNGRKVNIPSYQVSAGDEIAIREGSKKLTVLESAKEFASHRRRRTGWKSIATATRAGCSRCRSVKTSTCRSTSS